MQFGDKKMVSACALGMLMALGTVGQPVSAFAAPPLTIQTEQRDHPRIVRAIHEMEDALKELNAAPEDFGGNKGAAINDTRKAIHSMKKALYFRLKMDDAAIDRIQ